MSKKKTYFYIGAALVVIGLVLGLCITSNTVNKYKNLYYQELQNVEAYKIENSNLEGVARQHKMTIDDLYASQDSLDKKIVSVMSQLKIKDKAIKDLQYQLTVISRIDTIQLTDTIFIENTNIDTTYGDEWYDMHLQLKYPSTIITTPTFNSEQYVYIYTKEEYVGGKSRCFFINWFKKKYTVTEVKVEEKSPYIKIQKQKFIEVNK